MGDGGGYTSPQRFSRSAVKLSRAITRSSVLIHRDVSADLAVDREIYAGDLEKR